MKGSLRKMLAESNVGAIGIGVLLFWSIDSALWALWGPLYRAAKFVFTAVAILDIPYFSLTLTAEDRLTLFITYTYLFHSLAYLTAANLLSRWVYGEGPLATLSKCRAELARRTCA